VLAVGDVGFQKRCFEKIHEVLASGTTIIFISHSVGSIWAVCSKALFLDKGVSSGILGVEDACRRYELANYRASNPNPAVAPESLQTKDDIASFIDFQVCDARTGVARTEFEGRQDIGLKMTFCLKESIPDLIIRYSIDAVHYRFIATSDSAFSEGIGVSRFSQGVHEVTTILSAPRFRPGIYYVNIALCRKSMGVHLCTQRKAASFIVRPFADRFLYDVESPAVMDLDATYIASR
jgi:lipopolysaccharide transport system ATP-binding protein